MATNQAAAARPLIGPALLRGLDHVRPSPDGWISECPNFGCGGLLHIHPVGLEYRLDCDRGCPHDEIVDYLQCDTRTERAQAQRAWVALLLALTPDAWAGLLLGLPVHPTAIDLMALARLRKLGLWQ